MTLRGATYLKPLAVTIVTTMPDSSFSQCTCPTCQEFDEFENVHTPFTEPSDFGVDRDSHGHPFKMTWCDYCGWYCADCEHLEEGHDPSDIWNLNGHEENCRCYIHDEGLQYYLNRDASDSE